MRVVGLCRDDMGLYTDAFSNTHYHKLIRAPLSKATQAAGMAQPAFAATPDCVAGALTVDALPDALEPPNPLIIAPPRPSVAVAVPDATIRSVPLRLTVSPPMTFTVPGYTVCPSITTAEDAALYAVKICPPIVTIWEAPPADGSVIVVVPSTTSAALLPCMTSERVSPFSVTAGPPAESVSEPTRTRLGPMDRYAYASVPMVMGAALAPVAKLTAEIICPPDSVVRTEPLPGA